MEGARIRSSVGLYRDVQKDTTVLDGDKVLNLKAGDRVLVNLVSFQFCSPPHSQADG